jgi:hypothetical protein
LETTPAFVQFGRALEKARGIVAGDSCGFEICARTLQIGNLGPLVGFRAANPRPGRCDAGLRVFDLRLKIPSVEFGEKLSSFHNGIKICIEFLNLA